MGLDRDPGRGHDTGDLRAGPGRVTDVDRTRLRSREPEVV